jgi:hypothetical protein
MSPSLEANSLTVHSTSQEIHRLLLNTKVYYRVHNSPPPASILSQMNPIHILQPSFPKALFNIILPSLPFRFL